MVWKKLQQGDSFGFPLFYKENGVTTEIPQGYILSVGFFDCFKRPLFMASESNGALVRVSAGVYFVQVSHKESVNMIGNVTVEFVLHDGEGNIVNHSSNMAMLSFEPRGMNKHI